MALDPVTHAEFHRDRLRSRGTVRTSIQRGKLLPVGCRLLFGVAIGVLACSSVARPDDERRGRRRGERTIRLAKEVPGLGSRLLPVLAYEKRPAVGRRGEKRHARRWERRPLEGRDLALIKATAKKHLKLPSTPLGEYNDLTLTPAYMTVPGKGYLVVRDAWEVAADGFSGGSGILRQKGVNGRLDCYLVLSSGRAYLVDFYVEPAGGSSKVGAGTITVGSSEFTYENATEGPAHFVVVIDVPGGRGGASEILQKVRLVCSYVYKLVHVRVSAL